jgi:nucleoside-diphosphate-sugar epimerase
MPVLVTGATGFLGGRLAQVLAARGENVRILVRPGRDLRHLVDCKVQTVQGSLTDVDSLAEAVKGVSYIYHCAGCSADWAPPSVFYQANVEGVKNILDVAARIPGLERFVHISTTDVYGYPQVPCEESQPLKDAGLPYNATKVLGEKAVWEANRGGLPVTILRPATIYGPRGTVFAQEIAEHLREGSMAVIDHGRATGGFLYVDSAVDAMVAAAASGMTVGQAYNLSDGTNATWRTYVDGLADRLGYRHPWIDIPSWIALPMAGGLEAAYRVGRITRRPLLTRHAVHLFSRHQEYPAAKARHDFGFAPSVAFEEGMARTAAWLKSQPIHRP